LWIFETEISASEGSSSNEMRIAQIMNGIHIFISNPLGIGNASYPAAAESIGLTFPQGTPPDPHNTYIQVLSGFGILGATAYCLALAYLPFTVLSRQMQARHQKWPALLVLFSLYFQGLFIGELLTQPLSWILFGHILGDLSRKPSSE
jgi:O-antigen ligase